MSKSGMRGWPGTGPNTFYGDFSVEDGNVSTTGAISASGDLTLSDSNAFTTTLQCITPTANRTLSLPNADGTVGLVAGSSGQPIYNNAGAYAGLSTATIGATGNISLSLNGAVSTTGNSGVPVAVTGTWVTTGGNATTTKPQVLIEPSGATSTAWSTSGTGLGVNAASGFAGNLLDLQVNGSSRASLRGSDGRLTVSGALDAAGFIRGPSLVLGTGSSDPIFEKDASFTVGIRNSTFAQTFRVYNTYTSSTNYELGKLEWSSSVFIIGPERGSAGGSVREFSLRGATAVGTDQAGGQVTIRGGQGTGTGAGGLIVFETASPSTTGSSANTSTERFRIGTSAISYNQAAPIAVDASATVTVADLQVGILTSDAAVSTPVTVTLPTGTNMDGGFTNPYTNQTIQWSVINLDGTETVTVAGNTAHTLVGSATVAANVSARWASRRTAANTWVSYRLS